jgi:hypothetical protein
MKYLAIVFLSGLLFGLGGVANATPPTNDDLYQMFLKQQEKIVTLEANQRSLERDVTNSKLREAHLRDDLHKAKTQLASVQKAASNDFGEPTYDAPQREQGFVASAGLLYVKPYAANKHSSDITNYDYGFNISAGYQDANNVDFSINYKHFFTDDASPMQNSGLVGGMPNLIEQFTVNYDVLDFETGKRLQLADSVSMRLSGGLRFAHINENSFTQFSSCCGLGGAIAISNNGGESDLWGVGIKAGIAPEWNPNNSNFRMFSSLSGAYLAGKWNSKINPGLGAGASLTSYSDHSLLFSMVDAEVGIGYLMPTSIGDIEIKASYQYELLDISDTPSFDYRGYQGFYGSIGYAFDDIN